MSLDDKTLEDLERLDREATPWPWEWRDATDLHTLADRCEPYRYGPRVLELHDDGFPVKDSDREFIAVARSALPALVADMKSSRATLHDLRAEVERFDSLNILCLARAKDAEARVSTLEVALGEAVECIESMAHASRFLSLRPDEASTNLNAALGRFRAALNNTKENDHE